ncbi:hypothetical protein H4F18_09770 [Vibrio scophthalmi]|uniref:hypothetical protein n=1 Tax=Vibrio scophthalmi TaxID=45658 RepID=UPI002FF06B24
MIKASDFQISQLTFDFKKDQYPLSKIKNARVKANAIKDHLIRILTIGLIVSSVVWMICPQSLGVITGPISIIIGVLSGVASTRKYELQIEFQHADETGLQWISVAKTNNKHIESVFEQQVGRILERIA